MHNKYISHHPARIRLDATQDVAIQAQAFIFNLFGCLDNLAWVWVLEQNITKPDGAPLPPEWIGLRPKNIAVRNSLSEELHNSLKSMAEWFEYLENYRHALAHRIPLYIPPFAIAPHNEEKYRDLEVRIGELMQQRQLDKMQAIKREQDALKFFRPFFAGQINMMEVHPQILCDFKTIESIGAKLLDDLEGLAA
jgi:hypothetical protein